MRLPAAGRRRRDTGRTRYVEGRGEGQPHPVTHPSYRAKQRPERLVDVVVPAAGFRHAVPSSDLECVTIASVPRRRRRPRQPVSAEFAATPGRTRIRTDIVQCRWSSPTPARGLSPVRRRSFVRVRSRKCNYRYRCVRDEFQREVAGEELHETAATAGPVCDGARSDLVRGMEDSSTTFREHAVWSSASGTRPDGRVHRPPPPRRTGLSGTSSPFSTTTPSPAPARMVRAQSRWNASSSVHRQQDMSRMSVGVSLWLLLIH